MGASQSKPKQIIDRFGCPRLVPEDKIMLDKYKVEHPGVTFLPCSIYHKEAGSCNGFSMFMFNTVLLKAIKVYLPVHIVPSLAFHAKDWMRNPAKMAKIAGMNIGRSTAFLCAYIVLFSRFICLFRNLIKADVPATPMAAGFLCSFFSVLVEKPNRARELGLYCIPRVAEGVFNVGLDRKWWKSIKGGEMILWSVSMAFLMYFQVHERRAIKRTYRSMIDLFFGVEAVRLAPKLGH